MDRRTHTRQSRELLGVEWLWFWGKRLQILGAWPRKPDNLTRAWNYLVNTWYGG